MLDRVVSMEYRSGEASSESGADVRADDAGYVRRALLWVARWQIGVGIP